MRIGLCHSLLVAALAGLCLSVTPTSAGTFEVASKTEYRVLRSKVDAAHFLSRATFGPTKADIEDLALRIRQIGKRAALTEWIDDQFALPATLHQPLAVQMINDDGYGLGQNGVYIQRYRYHAWWDTVLTAEDQLRQRVGWALAQIAVVSESGAGFQDRNSGPYGVPRWLGLSNYYDMLLNNSFGNYRNVLTDVSLHPIMGVYLTHVRNRKADPSIDRFPDENYAREVMQLFSIGVNELRINGNVKKYRNGPKKGQPIETYTNEDIKTFARVFTGLAYASEDNNFWSPRTFERPMKMVESQHDTEEKTLLRGAVLPANQSGLDDIAGALDNLFEHPNCAPFMARRLIQRLVKSNPSKGYIKRVALKFIDNGEGVRGDMKAVIKAVLLDKEAMNSLIRRPIYDPDQLPTKVIVGMRVRGRGTEWSRLREPVLRYSAMIRAFDPVSDYPTGRMMLLSQRGNLNQNAYQSPSVFNFYLPDHKPQGAFQDYQPSRRLPDREMFAPEFEIMTTVSANKTANMFRYDITDQKVDRNVVNTSTTGLVTIDITLDMDEEFALAETDPAGLVEHLNLLLCHGSMSDATQQIITDAITEETTNAEHRAEMAILTTLTSPDCAVSE